MTPFKLQVLKSVFIHASNLGLQRRVWSRTLLFQVFLFPLPAPAIPRATIGIVGRVKAWVKSKNNDGKYIRLRTAWRLAKSIYRHYPKERFLSGVTVGLKTRIGKWKLLKFPPWFTQGRFYVCVVNNALKSRHVVKLPRGNTSFSRDLIERLKTAEEYESYSSVLTALKKDPWLQHHSVKVWNVQRDGGYCSEYCDGINLAEYRDQFLRADPLSKQQRRGLLEAIGGLLTDLRGYYKDHGKLIGDWQLHNMLYLPEAQTIVNVDAEGFFSYSGGQWECNLSFVEDNLRSLAQLISLKDSPERNTAMILDIFRQLDVVRHSGEQYSATFFVAGYHSLNLKGTEFRGQRSCAQRIAQIPYDFRNKRVMDLGCNVGGMLHALSGVIKKGYGFDFNSNCINAAQLIKKFNRADNIEFYTFDLDQQDLSLLHAYLNREKVDICFLLSVCLWLRNWPAVIRAAAQSADALVFEANGTSEEQSAQVEMLHQCYSDIALVSDSSTDDPSMTFRKLYLCSGSRWLAADSSSNRVEKVEFASV